MNKKDKKIIKKIEKGKKVKYPVFIETSPNNYMVIFRDGDFIISELTEEYKQNINKLLKEIKK